MTSNHWSLLETVGDYYVWRRPVAGAYVYQVTKDANPPDVYAGYANKHALLRMKGLI